ncbi:MAG: response regulator [Patescibacteria group bacterium]|nr:response regulator [Patescibacteria group bacterium]
MGKNDNRRQKILIIEDEIPMLETVATRLVYEGFYVLKAKNEERGSDIAFNEHPDLILLDATPQKIDSITIFEKLQKDDWGKKVDVIILSKTDYNVVANDISRISNDYIMKSDCKLKDIIKKIKTKLKKRQLLNSVIA